jgi:peroxiredoxin
MTLRRAWLAAGVAVVVVAAGAVAWWRGNAPRVEVGARAPDFTATDLATGKTVSLRSTYHGTVTLVNVWATYCIPCRQEMPAMDSLYHALGPQGFRIAAVSIDATPPDVVRHFAEQYHLTFDILHDPAGDIQDRYHTTGVPESFLVDRDGRIVRIVQHGTEWNSPEIRRIVSTLLSSPAS